MNVISFLIGLLIFLMRKVQVYNRKTVKGTPAKIIGLLLMAPFIFTVLLAFSIAFVDQDSVFGQSIDVLSLIMMVIAVLVAVFIFIKAPNTPDTALDEILPELPGSSNAV